MEVTIRTGNKNDWQDVQRLNVCVYKANKQYDPHLDMQRPTSDVGSAFYQKQLSDSDTLCLIAELGGQAVGYIIGGKRELAYRKLNSAEIYHMGVAPEHRSQGIGSKLLAAFKKLCKEKGFDSVFVSVYFKNKQGIGFYEKSGFAPIDLGLETTL